MIACMIRFRQTGFTLIELMITMIIASILAAIAIPVYRDHMLRSRLPDAMGALSTMHMRLEQSYQDNRIYGNAVACGVSLPPPGMFTYTCVAQPDGQSYLLTATGTVGGAMASFTYTLNQAGLARTVALPTGWGSVPVNCWIRTQGGAC